MDEPQVLGMKGQAEVVQIFRLFDANWPLYFATEEEARYANKIAYIGHSGVEPYFAIRFDDGRHLVYEVWSEICKERYGKQDGFVAVSLTTREDVEREAKEHIRRKLTSEEAQLVGL
ncbi:MAG: hypothetical protein ABA06_03120 [Parcubacteria bacterium C7867-001]|nr:MAG: hypothetical protein ABA06_03120 [Parcubacteria bacterium C7867-001]